MIRTVEELSLNAWPALHSLLVDGWVLRFADGYTRRANSVNPLYPSEQDAREKLRFCEQVYRDRGLRAVFKMTAASHPDGLDALLAAEGYESEATTSVQLLALSSCDAGGAVGVGLAPQMTEEWDAAFCRMGEIGAERRAIHRRLLESILPEKRYALVEADSRVVACGLGVLQAGYLGLYDVVVDPGWRRRGFGERLLRGLLGWGSTEGAHTAYLQVMLGNEPALGLYGGLGFREAYRYWYRVRR